ncbi:MAG: hypothetical protein ACI4GW_06540 [Lachnospiraceae bacterium]
MEMPECIIREEDIVGEFCEGVPVELQQLLVYHNGSIYNELPEESDLLLTYRVYPEYIPDYDPADLPLAVGPSDDVSNMGLSTVDIDSNGEEEYMHERTVGRCWQTTVLEYDDEYGWNIIGQGTISYMIARYANSIILDYEGKKYIMLGNVLVCQNEAYCL